jgi:hypothetical protein
MKCMRIALLFGCLLASMFAFVACGDDEPEGPGGSDEDYLTLICQGTQDFSNALVSKTTPDEIAEVIRDFIETMKNANPPADLRDFNDDFVQYLEDSVAEPTSLVTRQPPLPDDDVQRRLASKELSVEACKNGTFFSRGLADK